MGSIAGPLVAVACSIPLGIELAGLRDSKTLTEKRRRAVFDSLMNNDRVVWHMAAMQPDHLAQVGNLHCAQRDVIASAVGSVHAKLRERAIMGDDDRVVAMIDGDIEIAQMLPRGSRYAMQPVVRGDGVCPSIAAASIIAKVVRDNEMVKLASLPQYAAYGFDNNKGYPTAAHTAAVKMHGRTDVHRRPFTQCIGFRAKVANARPAILPPQAVKRTAMGSPSPQRHRLEHEVPSTRDVDRN